MHRINPIHYGSAPKHSNTQIALLTLLVRLEITLAAGETIGTVQRQDAIDTIDYERRSLEQCSEGIESVLKYVVEPRLWTHSALIGWLNALSIDLKLAQAGVEDGKPRAITPERVAEGRRLVAELDSCRTQTRFDR